jgi:acyl carrier protein
MRDELRKFIVESLQSMNYDVSDLDDSTELGPAGLDLESLALAELAVRLEDQFGLRFSDDDMETLGVMSVGEFTLAMSERLAAGQGTAGAGASQDGAVTAADSTV